MEKPTLLQLRREHNHAASTMITSQQLADIAVIPLAEEFQMELGCPTSAQAARSVLDAFNTLTGRTYTLADISVILAPPAQEGVRP